jgi:hypothetical protein
MVELIGVDLEEAGREVEATNEPQAQFSYLPGNKYR